MATDAPPDEGPWSETDVSDVESWLPGWLPERRWFADKSRPIKSCRFVRARSSWGDRIVAGVVRVRFLTGDDADYVVVVRRDDRSDAVDSPRVLRWLANLFDGTEEWSGVVGLQRWEVDETARLDAAGARPLGVEQSNTSIRFGDRWVVKLNRRLSFGPSPELELSGLLNRWDGPRCAPRTVAALSVQTDAGAAPLAIQAELVPNEGDGWAYVLAALRDEAGAGRLGDGRATSLREVRAVAELTGDLHAALARDPWTADLAPERITAEVAAGWGEGSERALDVVLRQLTTVEVTLTGRSERLADLVSAARATLREQLAGFQALVGSQRTRVHGDYHLGQVLRTPGGRYVAIDFDGEPQRTLAERREKYSPLRDVAGMMRSLAYAAGTVQAEHDDVDAAGFPAWERAARGVFLDTYLARLAANRADLLPRDPERIRLALAALELEKAVYEVGYELDNRPDWAWIPLSRLLRTL